MRMRSKRLVLRDVGEELFGGKVRCRFGGCGKWCSSCAGQSIHLRKRHGVSVDEITWEDAVHTEGS